MTAEGDNSVLVKIIFVSFLWKFIVFNWKASSRGLVVKAEDSRPRGPGSNPHYGDHLSGTIHLDQKLGTKIQENL
jgi:hypothetical protein